jgi:hypothetical protein
MLIAPKHVEAVLMSILMSIFKLFLRQFTCASVGEWKNFDNIKMLHGMCVEISFWAHFIPLCYIISNTNDVFQSNAAL